MTDLQIFLLWALFTVLLTPVVGVLWVKASRALRYLRVRRILKENWRAATRPVDRPELSARGHVGVRQRLPETSGRQAEPQPRRDPPSATVAEEFIIYGSDYGRGTYLVFQPKKRVKTWVVDGPEDLQ